MISTPHRSGVDRAHSDGSIDLRRGTAARSDDALDPDRSGRSVTAVRSTSSDAHDGGDLMCDADIGERGTRLSGTDFGMLRRQWG